MRVGLNSGEVVVRAIGNDLHMDYSAVGETTVLAARMEQTATPGSIRLTPATLRLVEGWCRSPPWGCPRQRAGGAGGGIRAARWRRSPAALAGGGGAGPDALCGPTAGAGGVQGGAGEHWARAGGGLLGEAGVGKSRLVYEVVHSHRTQGWLLESASVSYGKPRRISRSSICSSAMSRWRTATTPAPSGQSDGAGADARRRPPGDHSRLAGAPGRAAGGQPVSDA